MRRASNIEIAFGYAACPTCGSAPGDPCRGKNGATRRPHKTRMLQQRNVCACGRTKRITEKTCMMCRTFPEPLSKYRAKRKLAAPQPSERAETKPSIDPWKDRLVSAALCGIGAISFWNARAALGKDSRDV